MDHQLPQHFFGRHELTSPAVSASPQRQLTRDHRPTLAAWIHRRSLHIAMIAPAAEVVQGVGAARRLGHLLEHYENSENIFRNDLNYLYNHNKLN